MPALIHTLRLSRFSRLQFYFFSGSSFTMCWRFLLFSSFFTVHFFFFLPPSRRGWAGSASASWMNPLPLHLLYIFTQAATLSIPRTGNVNKPLMTKRNLTIRCQHTQSGLPGRAGQDRATRGEARCERRRGMRLSGVAGRDGERCCQAGKMAEWEGGAAEGGASGFRVGQMYTSGVKRKM